MKQIVLILENELLALLYKTNLIVYLNAHVLTFNTFDQFLKEKSKLGNFDLIITQSTFKSISIENEVIAFLNSDNYSGKLITIGEQPLNDPRALNISESLNIQLVLSNASKCLEITAQKMAAISVEEYFPIDIEFVQYLKKAPTNLYLEIASEFVHFVNKDSGMVDVLRDLKKEGVKKIFVKSIERLDAVAKISEVLRENLIQRTQLSTSQKKEVISSGFDFFIGNYVDQQAATEIVFTANVCARVMGEVAEESPDFLSLFNSFKENRNGFIYIHTMLCTYVATHIIRNVEWGGESQKEKINFVLFFHDILLVPIYNKYPHLKNEEDLFLSEELTRTEKHTVANHARLSAEMVSTFKKCPLGADQLIKQHHGMSTGIGFASEFKDDISPMSKVIIISEAFIEEFIKFKEQNQVDKLDMVIVIQKLSEKFKKNSYKKIIDTLLTLRI